MSLKQPPQIGGEAPCCAGTDPVPFAVANVFRGLLSEPCLVYSMRRCTACGRRTRGPDPSTRCTGLAPCPCSPGGRDRPCVEFYRYDPPTPRRLRKCLCCGRETWLATSPSPCQSRGRAL